MENPNTTAPDLETTLHTAIPVARKHEGLLKADRSPRKKEALANAIAAFDSELDATDYVEAAETLLSAMIDGMTSIKNRHEAHYSKVETATDQLQQALFAIEGTDEGSEVVAQALGGTVVNRSDGNSEVQAAAS